MSNSPTLFSSDDEDEGPELEEVLLKKFQAMMQGVPPPSSITMSKLSASDMLAKYYENGNSCKFDNLVRKKSHKKENSTPLVYYFNSSKTSEEIANISQKVLSRYVHSETMSSCNIWFESYTRTNSAKKSLTRSSLGFSPGSRLSHLARRRQIFSSENLQKLANSERRRHIEIEKQNASKSRSCIIKNMIETEKSNSFKRALFLSPEDGYEGKQCKLFISSQQNLVSNSVNNTVHDNWFSQHEITTSSSKKRKRLESRERNGHWPRRALTFSEKDLGKNQDSSSSNAKVISEIQLNLHHKTKILWAVSVTLKEKHMHSSNPQFKPSASALFMICRKNLSKILNSKVEGGTSDKILHFAREHVDGILKKLGISAGNKTEDEFKTDTDHQEGVEEDTNSDSISENNISASGVTQTSFADTQVHLEAGNEDATQVQTASASDVNDAASNEKENINTDENNIDLVS